MLSDALSTQGVERNKGWRLERLPNSHPLYHCYFDFAGPPPGTAERFPQFENFDYLEGVILNGKLPGVLTRRTMRCCGWTTLRPPRDSSNSAST